MSRQDSSFGLRNYVQTVSGSSATPLLSPPSAGINPSFPSPLYPLTTTTYPVGVFISVPRDSGQTIDGHPFEVSLTANISGTTTTNVLVSLFQATQASWIDGPYAGTYTLGTLGTGCTNILTGTATSGITSTVSVSVWMKAQFVWSSKTGILGLAAAQQYISGNVVSVAATANVSSLKLQDLNFIPQFTFASGGTNTITISEFTINRL